MPEQRSSFFFSPRPVMWRAFHTRHTRHICSTAIPATYISTATPLPLANRSVLFPGRSPLSGLSLPPLSPAEIFPIKAPLPPLPSSLLRKLFTRREIWLLFLLARKKRLNRSFGSSRQGRGNLKRAPSSPLMSMDEEGGGPLVLLHTEVRRRLYAGGVKPNT
jgi:hypothetical protein